MSTLQLLPTREMPSSMTVAELINAKREMLELMERKHRDIVEHRLRYYSPYPKQIEFHAAGLTFRERLLMAANQSGKTWSAGAEVAMHLTGQYPTNWPGRYMRAANRWMAGSESAELTKKGLQRILLGNPEVESEWGTGMIPKDCILDVSRRAGVADAVASIVVKHQCGDPSTLQLNSYDQGRTKWQADTVDGVWFDEEPPMELYTEGLTRTNTTQGPVMMTFTPLLGQSAVVLRFRRERPAGTHVTNMTIDDALHYTAEDRAAIIASYPEHEREARTRGIPIMGSGRVFPIAEAGISVESFHIPAHWPRIVGLDFGWDHPAAAVWMAWDRDTDTVYVYDVWRAREQSVAMQSLVLRARGDWIPVAWPHDGLQHDKGSGEQLAKQYKTAGVAMLRERAQFEDGTNGVEAGIQEMLKRMQTRQLRVFKHLEDWFEEFRDYHRKDGLIVKERDDLMAATRYGLMELRHALTEYEARGSMAQALGVFGPATAFGVLDPTMGY